MFLHRRRLYTASIFPENIYGQLSHAKMFRTEHTSKHLAQLHLKYTLRRCLYGLHTLHIDGKKYKKCEKGNPSKLHKKYILTLFRFRIRIATTSFSIRQGFTYSFYLFMCIHFWPPCTNFLRKTKYSTENVVTVLCAYTFVFTADLLSM